MASDEIVCHICGFKNPAASARCAACGAKLEVLGAVDTDDDDGRDRSNQQDGFVWKWVFIAFAVYMVLQSLILVAAPMVIPSYDPQGTPGIFISVAVWFLGGIMIGAISPGKTFLEPSAGALMAVIPTVIWLSHIDEIHGLSIYFYILGGLVGVMATFFGAFLGEKVQSMIRT